MGCFYLVLTRPDVKEVWVIIGAVTQYWFSWAANGHSNGNGAANGAKSIEGTLAAPPAHGTRAYSRAWIALFRMSGWRLTDVSDGGEGGRDPGKHIPE
jgi:hypothetical protein